MDIILEVSEFILMVGGAILVLLANLLLLRVIFLIGRLSRLVQDVSAKYELTKYFLYQPIKRIMMFFQE